jgi:long-chain fatty acid transport protein
MKKINIVFATLTLIILISIPPEGMATDGYFSNGIGTRSKGFAGAGIAFLSNPFSAANNPAGIGFIEKKWSLELGVGLFNPNRQYTIIGNPTPPNMWYGPTGEVDPRYMRLGFTPGTVESGSQYFVIPTLAFTYKLGEKNTLAFNFWGNGGMNTNYDSKTYYSEIIASFGNPMPDGNPNPMANVTAPTGVNITQIFASLTYARKLGENHSLGISPIFVYQTFEANGLQAFADMGMAGANGAFVSNNGTSTSTGFGVKIGYQGELFDGFRLGASFTPRINMSAFEEYKGLFAEEGDFDVPLTWTAGASYDVGENITLLFDFKQILYSQIKSIANPMTASEMLPFIPNPAWDGSSPDAYMPNPTFVPLGDENGAGFGWDDMNIFKIGAEFRMVENWDFRLGYSHGKQPIGEDDVLFNMLAPAVIEDHLSLGFSRHFGEKALHFAFTYSFNNSLEGQNSFDENQQIQIEMNQLEFELAFTF